MKKLFEFAEIFVSINFVKILTSNFAEFCKT